MQGEYRGDFTRDTFDQANHFSRVLLQQGRVLLDADWNEQNSILLHYLRTLATDLLGPRKAVGDGFKVQPGANPKGNFEIKPGRFYVDGILCENHGDIPTVYSAQADVPVPLEDTEKLKEGFSLVYLDVWERHITALENGLIREVALGGPDTATRARVIQQIKVDNANERKGAVAEAQPLKDAADVLLKSLDGRDEDSKKKAASNYLKALVDNKLQLPNRGKLRARAKKMDEDDKACSISPDSSFRGAENHLYRVEIHLGGNINTATFKWSRENGSITFPIRSVAGRQVMLDHLGRDLASSLQVNDWVEVVDDNLALRGKPGLLRQVESIDSVELSVTLKESNPPLPAYSENSPNHPLLRRWDFQGDGFADKALPVKEGAGEEDQNWIDLEDGIQIQFAKPVAGVANTYRSGDYWLIPARVATGDVEWPQDKNAAGDALSRALPPHGVEHRYAPLAIISVSGDTVANNVIDCRNA